MGFLIAVAAEGHPECDPWVMDTAVSQADEDGFILGKYIGLVDERDTTGNYYHAFVAKFDWSREYA